MEFRFKYMYDVIHSINITIKIVALPLLEPVFSLLYGYTRCLFIVCFIRKFYNTYIPDTSAAAELADSSKKSQHFKEKTQYLMNTL